MAFVYRSQIFFDELDPLQVLHNSRFLVHVERATVAFYNTNGHKWELDHADNPDQVHVVREFRIEFLSPVIGVGTMHIEIWVDRLGGTSCQYGFRCLSESGVEYARGSRTIVKIDPATRRPSAWTDKFRADHEKISR